MARFKAFYCILLTQAVYLLVGCSQNFSDSRSLALMQHEQLASVKANTADQEIFLGLVDGKQDEVKSDIEVEQEKRDKLLKEQFENLQDGDFTNEDLSHAIATLYNDHYNYKINGDYARYTAMQAVLNNFIPRMYLTTLEHAKFNKLPVFLSTGPLALVKVSDILELDKTEQKTIKESGQKALYEYSTQDKPTSFFVEQLASLNAEIKKNNFRRPRDLYVNLLYAQGLAEGMDAHSYMIIDSKNFMKENAPLFKGGGIGASIKKVHNGAFIFNVIEGNSAERAGLRYGDIITAVNDESTVGLENDKVIEKIRGELGTEINLDILRKDKILKFKVKRDVVTQQTVTSKNLNNSVYIKYNSFIRGTVNKIRNILSVGENKNKSIILDLRSNGGGDVGESQDLVELFLNSQNVDASDSLYNGIYPFLYTINKIHNNMKTKHSFFAKSISDENLVILIDGSSASASEIVSSTLKHHNRALIIGERSFGKGSMQTIYGISPNVSVAVTTNLYFTHKKFSPQYSGVMPHIDIQRDSEIKEKFEKQYESDYINAIPPVNMAEFTYSPSQKILDAMSCVKSHERDSLRELSEQKKQGDVEPDLQLITALQAAKCMEQR